MSCGRSPIFQQSGQTSSTQTVAHFPLPLLPELHTARTIGECGDHSSACCWSERINFRVVGVVVYADEQGSAIEFIEVYPNLGPSRSMTSCCTMGSFCWLCHGALRPRADIALAWLLDFNLHSRASEYTDHNWSQNWAQLISQLRSQLGTEARESLFMRTRMFTQPPSYWKRVFIKQITTLMDFGELIRNSVSEFLHERSVSGKYQSDELTEDKS